jgi:hypothetical protein
VVVISRLSSQKKPITCVGGGEGERKREREKERGEKERGEKEKVLMK